MKDKVGSYALIVNGIVVNKALWDGVTDWNPECDDLVNVDGIQMDIGWTYVDGQFLPPVIEEETPA